MNNLNKPIKVLHVVGAMNRAGQETFLMNLFKNIDRRKFHFLFLYNDSKIKSDYDEDIKTLGGSIVYPPNNAKHLKLFAYLKKNKDVDILYIPTNNAFSALYSVILGKINQVENIVVHSHSANSKQRILNYICRPILRHLNVRKYACSKLAGEWVFGKNAKDVQVIKNGIYQENFVVSKETRLAVRDSFNIAPNQLALVHIGRFIEVKNHKFLLDIFKNLKMILPEAILVLVGDGELQEEIFKEVEKLDLENSVIFAGTRSDISEILMGMDMFLLPSLYEGLPVTAIEAQASGLKCFLSDRITREAKISENVFFLPLNNNSELWAKRILNESKYERKNTSEQIKINGYDIREIANYIENDYYNLLLK